MSAGTKFHLVLPAAGSGQRMGSKRPKQYLEIHGRTLLQHTLERLGTMDCFCSIVLVLAADDAWWQGIKARLAPALQKKIVVVTGGLERCDSVRSGLLALAQLAASSDFVLVHDVVRPCVRASDVRLLIDVLSEEVAGGLLATPLRDTLKRADEAGRVETTIERTRLWCAATPQMFRYRILLQALEFMAANRRKVTDEAEAVEAMGYKVKLVQGRADNLKITYPDDLALAALILGAGD